MKKPSYTVVGIVATCTLAASSGFLAATAIGTGSQAPTKTVTIHVGTGATGPQGPIGPPGPAGAPGAESCPTGYTFGALIIYHSEGQVQIATCIKD